jgi:hypothetical protein
MAHLLSPGRSGALWHLPQSLLSQYEITESIGQIDNPYQRIDFVDGGFAQSGLQRADATA